MTLRDSFVLNAFGDAACALTPLRIGGEPARLAGMLRSRVPATAAFVAISLEVLAAWPVIIVAAGWLVWRYAPAWWAAAGPRLGAAAANALALGRVVVVGEPGRLAGARRRVASPAARTCGGRSAGRWSTGGGCRAGRWSRAFRCRFVNLATRVAILPVLALTLPSPPALGPLTLGSFALLYSQLVLPTPSGAGAVELGFLGGAAGDLGDRPGMAAAGLADSTPTGSGCCSVWRSPPGSTAGRGRCARASGAVERSHQHHRRSSASATPCGTSAGAHTTVPARPPGSRRPPSSSPFPIRRVEFVRAGVDVDRLCLSGLEAVEPDEQLASREQVGLGRLVGVEAAAASIA